MRRRKIALAAALCVALVILAYCVSWLPRVGCVCYKAHFHAGEHLPIDQAITEAMGGKQNPETFSLLANVCRHGKPYKAQVFTEYYIIQER